MDTYCRPCRKAYNQAYYLRTKERHNPGRYARRRHHEDQIFDLFMEYMQDKMCADCGESDIVVLEFDHQRDKLDEVGNMVRAGLRWSRILEEIAKCEIVCANCHRRRTCKTYGWRKGR